MYSVSRDGVIRRGEAALGRLSAARNNAVRTSDPYPVRPVRPCCHEGIHGRGGNQGVYPAQRRGAIRAERCRASRSLKLSLPRRPPRDLESCEPQAVEAAQEAPAIRTHEDGMGGGIWFEPAIEDRRRVRDGPLPVNEEALGVSVSHCAHEQVLLG